MGVAVRCRTCGLLPSTSAVRCATPKRCCSSTTATARSAEVDLLLDERVGADDDLSVAGGDELPSGGVLLCPERARQEGHPNAEWRAELVDCQEVLFGERLRRRHERSLATGLHGAKERMKGDDRLPRTHLSLKESLHGDGAREIGIELGHRPLLIGRQRERERRAVASDHVSRPPQRLRRRALARRCRTRKRET